MNVTPVTLPPGRARLATRTLSHRVAAGEEDDRDRRGRVFRRECRNVAAAGCDQGDLATNEIGRQSGQTLVFPLGPAIFNREIFAFDIPGLTQSLTEGGYVRRIWARQGAAAKTDHRPRLWRRPGVSRPPTRRSDCREDVAAPHRRGLTWPTLPLPR